jgi:alkylhydroperoxidase/carboxymuconolactone decarboxylase family protein YurZ
VSDVTKRFREAVVRRVLDGDGKTSAARRRAAFDHADPSQLLDKVTDTAWKVTDADIAAAKTSGLDEDEIFELVACAAIGKATRQLDAALAALDEAEKTR